jgi:hypothetical protein
MDSAKDSVHQLCVAALFDFLSNPDDYIVTVKSYLTQCLKLLSDNQQRLGKLRTTHSGLNDTIRTSTRRLCEVALKVRNYIALANGLRDIADEQREVTILREIKGRISKGDEVFDMDDLDKRSFFPTLVLFLTELKSQFSDLDVMYCDIGNLCNKILSDCSRGGKIADTNQKEAEKWKWIFGAAAVLFTAGSICVATGGLAFIGYGVATIAASSTATFSAAAVGTGAAVGAGATGVSAAGFVGAQKAHKKRVQYSQLETCFQQSNKKFEDLKEDTHKLQIIKDRVQGSSHSLSVKADFRCCLTRELQQLPKVLEKLCKALRAVDFEDERNKVESLISELKSAY